MSGEREFARIAPQPSVDRRWFAKLEARAWAIPAIDFFSTTIPEKFFGAIGVMTGEGFSQIMPRAEIGFFTGTCSGCFLGGEVIQVIRYPFRSQPSGHKYEWIAMGVGQNLSWAEQTGVGGGNSWEMDSNGLYPSHFIAETDTQGGEQFGPTFPGAPAPLSRDGGEIDRGKPIEFRWTGAEGKFYPIVQAPDD